MSGDFDMGVLTQAAMYGVNGSWAVFYGSDGLPSGQINFAIEEEALTGNLTHQHTPEHVAYWVFDMNQTTNLDAQKDVGVYSGSPVPYAIPGPDVIYTIKTVNTGSGAVDADTIFLVDSIPPDVTFYNGDIDDCGHQIGVVEFVNTGS